MGDFALDGVTILPYEVMFHTVTEAQLGTSDLASTLAVQYTAWMQRSVGGAGL